MKASKFSALSPHGLQIAISATLIAWWLEIDNFWHFFGDFRVFSKATLSIVKI
jgi:hypothetical protein